jgi:hypothetical protein
MSIEEQKEKLAADVLFAQEAKRLLDNKAYQAVSSAVKAGIIQRIESTEFTPEDADKRERLFSLMKIASEYQRFLEKSINDGIIAKEYLENLLFEENQ